MRILQVSSAESLGGGETHVLELIETLRQRGHDVLLAGRRNGPLKPDIPLPLLGSADVATVFALRRILQNESFNIVHAHVARDYTVVAAAAWGIPEPKVIFTRHLLYPVRRLPLYRRVDGWIATTAQIRAAIEPMAAKTSAVIPNWVDLNKFAYRPHPLHSPVAVGILGQVSPHKGHDDLIEAVRLLGDGYRLLIAGTGEAAFLETLNKKSAGLPVEFVGLVRASAFFETIDVLAVPSWEEPFGIVCLEAMAAGTPVVSTGTGGPGNIIRSGRDGLLVPPRDSRALADAIALILSDPALRSSIIEHARERVEMNYDISKIVPQIEDFYGRVMIRS